MPHTYGISHTPTSVDIFSKNDDEYTSRWNKVCVCVCVINPLILVFVFYFNPCIYFSYRVTEKNTKAIDTHLDRDIWISFILAMDNYLKYNRFVFS